MSNEKELNQSVLKKRRFYEKGLLGEDSPKVLLDTMIYLCGVHFALRSGQEHRSLQRNHIELMKPETDLPYIIYTENMSKNNSGGLSHRKVEPKQIVHHCNKDNPK